MSPPEPRTRASSGRIVGSIAWTLVPVVTFGLGTPFAFAGAAIRRRSLGLGIATVLYAALFTALMIVTPMDDSGLPETVFGLCFLCLTLGGTTNAILVRRRVFGIPRGPASRAPAPTGNQAAIADVRRMRDLRTQARAVAAEDHRMAKELGIGRPDLAAGGRRYEDGGLIDVNHVPAPVLATLPGITPELAANIVTARDQTDGFVSAEELSALAGLPPQLTSDLAEYVIFLP